MIVFKIPWFICICVCVCWWWGHTCITVSICRSEENSLESIQPNHVDSGDQTQGVRLSCKPLYGPKHLTGSNTISSIVEVKALAPENPNYDVKINLSLPQLLWMCSQVETSEAVAGDNLLRSREGSHAWMEQKNVHAGPTNRVIGNVTSLTVEEVRQTTI